jgi:hypothetical protein
MAYQFVDGFDNYGNSYTLLAGYPWAASGTFSGGSSGTAVTSTSDYRFAPPGSLPGGCVLVSQNNYIRQNLSGNPGTVIVGFGFKLTNLPGSGVGNICDFWDTGNFQCSLFVTANGGLQFYTGNGEAPGGGGVNNSTPLGTVTAANTILPGVWYGLQMQVVVATGTAGSVLLYINGSATATINASGLNTSGTGHNYATQVSIGPGNFSTAKYDDFFCFDGTTGFLNATLGGDARILTKMPASAGNYTNWTPNGLASNYQNVAVQPPSTSDYNANNTATTKDSYTMQSAGLAVAPYFVMERASLERDDAGSHTPSLFVRSGSTDSSGVVTPALTSSYLFYDAIFQNDPATSTAWTASGADNAQAGIIEG